MSYTFYIFFIAFTVRLLNLYFNEIKVESYLVEDQLMYWDWSLKKCIQPVQLHRSKIIT